VELSGEFAFPCEGLRQALENRNDAMKVTMERTALLKALGHVHRIVERRNTIPILSNVLIEASEGRLARRVVELRSVFQRQ
jgi:hypothetical protein